MAKQRALPLIMTIRNPNCSVELRDAFVIAERGEKDKIDHWAQLFGFETVTPSILLEMESGIPTEQTVESIVSQVRSSGADGLVIAGATFLRRAKLAERLPAALAESNLILWSANDGSLPISKEAIWL